MSNPYPWQVLVSPRVARQIQTYDRLTKLEVGGMGLTRDAAIPSLKATHTFVITKVWMMSAGEEASGGYCEIPAVDRAKMMFRLAKVGKADLLKVWWH